VHLLNEAVFGLLFAKDDAQRLELVREISARGTHMFTELMLVRGWLDTRRSRAGLRASDPPSAPEVRRIPPRGEVS
jgi:hypothetical protein